MKATQYSHNLPLTLAGIFVILYYISSVQTCSSTSAINNEIKISWVDSISDDFSFSKQWSYPEGIYKNEYGQLICEGFCPDEAVKMIDSNGKIHEDSLEAFYSIIDTTHLFHTIKSEAQCYEWNGADYIIAQQKEEGNIQCYTIMNSSTHSSLIFELKNNLCFPKIELNSITNSEIQIYNCSGGFIEIDKKELNAGWLKAKFHFNFIDPQNQIQPMFWKGLIFCKIVPMR